MYVLTVVHSYLIIGAIGSSTVYYSSATPQHNFIDLDCTGDESTILDCFHHYDRPCSLNNDANIFCKSTYKEM